MSKLKVFMTPQPDELNEGGIKRVVEAYLRYIPDYGIQFVDSDDVADVVASHVTSYTKPTVLHCHGLYWTADYPNVSAWEWKANAAIVYAIRHAKTVTVPSPWVAETFQRDMRFSPYVVPHGIDWQSWQHNEQVGDYIIGYGKNRIGDVCNPSYLEKFGLKFPNEIFLTTLYNSTPPRNVKLITGNVVTHSQWKRFVQRARVYINTTKETWGLGMVEAMAAGVPVLSYRYGGAVDLIQHGVNGYLAEPNNLDDLAEGLNYCLTYRDILGENGRELAKQWTWQTACEKVAGIYKLAAINEPAEVSVIIPVYNKSKEQVKRAVDSILAQTRPAKEIIIVNDGSSDSYAWVKELDKRIQYIEQDNSGVAIARNTGIRQATSQYINCLDADDWLEPQFLELCIDHLEQNRQDGIAYTGLRFHKTDGTSEVSQWPQEFDYNQQIQRHNQVPTACVFRRVAWERVGGYRSRYCPLGAGSEDAAFWTAIGAIGFGANRVTSAPLFNYSGGGQTSHDYHEIDWLDVPWYTDNQHPFASIATPKRMSHPVRQYDEPYISVIIPVGPGHKKHLPNCLDSLEIQHYRKWEAVVVWDTPEDIGDILDPYPYVQLVRTIGGSGAGTARNIGVKMARAQFIFFLDVDDFLVDMNALTEMMDAWKETGKIIHSGYYGRATWGDYEKAKEEYKERLVDYIDKTGQVIFYNRSGEFDCELAQKQPLYNPSSKDMPYYLWCTISILIPKAWHEAIGGFDEAMDTWEDVDYFWRLARDGYCFHRIPKPFLLYNYDNGYRREAAIPKDEASLQKFKNRIQYLETKYKDLPVKMCNCKTQVKIDAKDVGGAAKMEGDFVLIEFDFPGSDRRSDWGQQLPSPTGIMVGNRRLEYDGYSRNKGDRFFVHKNDASARPDMFRIVVEEPEPPAPVVKQEPLPEPELLAPQLKGTVLPEPPPVEMSQPIIEVVEPIILKPAEAQSISRDIPIRRGRRKAKK